MKNEFVSMIEDGAVVCSPLYACVRNMRSRGLMQAVSDWTRARVVL